jgi:replicative DNA helicase
MGDTRLRSPAHDLQAEAAVISACILDPASLPIAAAIVRPGAFYAQRHAKIFEALEALSADGVQIDSVQVATRLRDTGELVRVGGLEYLIEVVNAAPAVANVATYADTVARKARVRRMQLVAQRLTEQAYEPIPDEDGWLDSAEQQVHEILASRTDQSKPDTMRSVVTTVFRKLQEANARAARGEDGITGIRTGYEQLDESTGGLHDGESTIFAARPGIGKTSILMNVADHVAHRGYGVIVFSLEMPNEQIATRALCSAARVDVRKARTSMFDPSDWSKLSPAAQHVTEPKHWYLVDRPSALLDMKSYVRARASEMAKDSVKLGLVAVDYLQLMVGRDGVRSREESVSENARGLKLMAKEMGCPVIGLSQLNRGVESRNDKRPMLGDLRESGAIEEAADCVIGIYRDDYYHEDSKTPGIAELILLKNRHGPTGTVEVGFDAKSTTFFNLRDRP